MNNVRDLYPTQQKPITRDQLVTIADLEKFKATLLLSIKQLLSENKKPSTQWLKSYQVKKMLDISPGTLQTLRSNGTLPFTKIGGIIYYDAEDINKVLEAKKKQNQSFYQPQKKQSYGSY